MKTLSELLDLYSKLYKHYHNNHNEYGEIEMLAKFANMIATDASSPLTEMTALNHEQHLEIYHNNIIQLLNTKQKIYPCKCLKTYISNRVLELKKRVDEDPHNDKLYEMYQKWLYYQE